MPDNAGDGVKVVCDIAFNRVRDVHHFFLLHVLLVLLLVKKSETINARLRFDVPNSSRDVRV